MLRGKTVDLTASVAALTFGRQVWRDVDLALQLADGRLQVSRLRLALPGGPMEMLLSADASKQDVPISLTLHAPGIPLALLAHYAALPGDAAGDLHIETQLKAKGRSVHDLVASLDGPFAATMTHGSLSNAVLIELASASLQALGIEVPAQGETAIRCFGIVGSFNAGVGRFRTIALDTTYLQLDGAGQVDLGAETVALKPFGRRQRENPRHPGAAPEDIAVLFDLGREPTWAAVMPLDRSQCRRRFLFLTGNPLFGAGLIGTGTTGLRSVAGVGRCVSAAGVSRNGPEA